MSRARDLRPLWALAVVALGLGACTQVADERARRDLRIGIASGPGFDVRVEDGAAAVRAATPDRVHLWLQAPVVRVHLTSPPGAGPLELVMSNALPDATLTAVGPAVAVVETAGAVVTEKHWTVTPPPAGGTLVFRLAPPDADTPGPYRFAVFADVQEAIDRVGDIYARMAADPTIRFVVMSGDLTSRGTPDQLTRFEEEMLALPIPIYPTLGNHELGTRDDLFHDYFGRGNTSFVFREVQFTLLDTASATIAPLAYEWLDGWLRAGLDRVHFVFAHIPPLDPVGTRGGAFASRLEASKFLSLLAAGRVDTTFWGHVHSYYAYTNAGIPAYITGGGGAIPERLDGIGRHFLTVDADPVTALVQVAIVRID